MSVEMQVTERMLQPTAVAGVLNSFQPTLRATAGQPDATYRQRGGDVAVG